ncbi:MAG: ribonuclease J [Clostridia bacterium]|nr:ribonuclease J [Clostridia bacterium]
MQKNKKPGVNVIFLGGVDGIGMNMTAFEYENEIIAVDCGVAFPEDDMLGVDLVIPDFGYLEKNAEKLRTLLITHGHEDHIGAVPFFLKKFDKVPVYATRLTLGIIEGKLAENGIKRADLREIRAGETVRLGSAFEAEYINVNHSMPDSCAICIGTPCGRILHTGDLKVDFTPVGEKPIDLARLSELGRKGIRLLLCDSTNAERPGYTPSESSLAVSFDRIFNNEQRRIVIATFSSNVHRVQQIINAASKAGRKVAITGRSMQNFFSAAVKLGYLTVPDNIVIDLADVKKLPPSKVAVLTTGSQGEPMSALYRMAFGEHNMVTLGTDDLVVLSSSAIPGNEKLITKIINELYRRGAEVITYSNYDVHVSGHACREELKLMHALTAPEFFIPVHGEYKHLVAHAALAKDMGMPENRIMIPDTGEVIALSKRSLKRAGSVEAGSVMVDGSGIGDVSSIVLRERRRIAEEGVIFVSAGIDTGYMCISVMPEVTTRGFVYEKENADLVNKIAEVAYNSLIKTLSRDISDQSVIKSRLRDDIGDYARKRTGRKPTVVVLLSEVRQ